MRKPNLWDANEVTDRIVLNADVGDNPLIGIEMHGSVDDLDRDKLPVWIRDLRTAETNVRLFRRRLENMLGESRPCPVCGESVTGRADRRFCSGACRVRAHRGYVTGE